MSLLTEIYKILVGVVLIIIGLGITLGGINMTGPNNSVYLYAYIFLGVIMMVLGGGIARSGSKEGNIDPEDPSNNNSPLLHVSCRIIDNNGVEQTAEKTIKSNDMIEAEEIFKEFCAEKGYKLIDDPSITIKSDQE